MVVHALARLSALVSSNPLYALITLLALTSFETAVAQNRSTDSPENGQIAIRLSGQVVDTSTGNPVPRAETVCKGEDDTSTPPVTTLTDGEGRFECKGLRPGRYRISARRDGYLRSEYGSKGQGRPGLPITLTPDRKDERITIRLIRLAAVNGRVFGEDGDPIKDVTIQALRDRFQRGRKVLLPTAYARSNDRGEFRISDLEPGRYVVVADRMNYLRPRPAHGDTSETGYVTTYFPNGSEPSQAQVLLLEPGADLPGVDFSLKKTRVFSVRGRIARPAGSEPLRGNLVLAMPNTLMRASTPIREDGTFELHGLPPGSFPLIAMMQTDGGQSTASSIVEVSDRNIDDFVLTPTVSVTIVGKVRSSASGEPLPQASVALIAAGEGVGRPGSVSTVVKGDGAFTLTGVNPQRYRLEVGGLSGSRFYLKEARLAGVNVLDQDFDVTSSVTVDLLLSADTGSVSGEVIEAG
ncbi:MAG TPA: hypothetical protein DEH78_08790, partial [Solibacterales bacterium]|nr:hypothetical protein [Bryobacterales bacterium]